MKKGSTLFLKAVIIMMGLGVLTLCVLILTQVNPTAAGDYYPILLGMTVTSIPFFTALYQTLKLLNYIDKDQAFSDLSVNILRKIKYCAISISSLYTLGAPYIFIVAEKDDAPGVVAITLVIISASIVIAVFAAVLQKLLKKAIDFKSENELTV